MLAFGTPPGVVLSLQDPTLLGRATADLDINSAYAVASLDAVLSPPQRGVELTGVVELLAVAPLVEAPMQLINQARALAGRGLQGDRYADGTGTFSPRGAHRPGYELTLIAAEVVEDLTARDARLDFASTRRNVLTRGIDVNALVGRDLRVSSNPGRWTTSSRGPSPAPGSESTPGHPVGLSPAPNRASTTPPTGGWLQPAALVPVLSRSGRAGSRSARCGTRRRSD